LKGTGPTWTRSVLSARRRCNGVQFSPGSIVGLAAYFSSDEKLNHVIVGTNAGKVHEIWWESGHAGIDGQGDLQGVQFSPGSIVGLAAYFSSDEKLHDVIVGTNAGKVHEIWWKSGQAGIEGQGDLQGVQFSPGSIVGLAAFLPLPPSQQKA